MSLMIISVSFVSINTIRNNPQFISKIYHATRLINESTAKFYNDNFLIRNNNYSLHRNVAKLSPAGLIIDNNSIDILLEAGKLVKVNSSSGYRIGRLQYSKSVLTDSASIVLKLIGKEFELKLGKGKYFVVTSLTRTIKQQKMLSKINSNATKGVSTHCYGVSFDISYVRFNGKRGHNSKLRNILSNILLDLQKKGVIYIINERNNNCFHITVK